MDHNNEKEASHYGKLLAKALSGTLTQAEQAEFDAWVATGDHRALYKSLQQEKNLADGLMRFEQYDAQSVYALFEAKRAASSRKPRRITGWLPYAAAVLLVASVVGWWAIGIRPSTLPTGQETVGPGATEILPGGNRATLTLADGWVIDLSEDQEGISVSDGISYLDGSSVLGEQVNEGTGEAASAQVYTLTTPKGGTYQVTLPDGTAVWLNAASTIKYPNRFASNERSVEISGEAYFSVAIDKSKPFKVTSNGQTVEVLGTEFNICAYADATETKTTLVQGSVAIVNLISNGVERLRPGNQSVTRGATIDIRQVDVESYISWKSGYFYFKNTPFSEVMNQLARWYDIEVVYNGEVPKETFSGKMDRGLTLNAVLKLLDVSDIRARIAGADRLIVY